MHRTGQPYGAHRCWRTIRAFALTPVFPARLLSVLPCPAVFCCLSFLQTWARQTRLNASRDDGGIEERLTSRNPVRNALQTIKGRDRNNELSFWV